MVRMSRRRLLRGTAAVLGGVLAAACALGEAPPPSAGPPLRRPAPTLSVPMQQRGPTAVQVLFGPWIGSMYERDDLLYQAQDGRSFYPHEELLRTTAFAAFRSRHPDSKLTFETTGDTVPALQHRQAAGTLPDLFEADDRRSADLLRAGAVQSVEGYVRNWPAASDFVRPAWNAGRSSSQQWGLPLFTFAYTLYFNSAVLREAGIAQLPATWEDLREVAARSKVVNGTQLVRQGLNTPDAQWFWWLLQTLGATLYEAGEAGFTGGEAEAVLDFLKTLYATVRPAGVTRPPPAGEIFVYVGPEPAPKNAAPPPLESDSWILGGAEAPRWEHGQIAHAWLPLLPPQPDAEPTAVVVGTPPTPGGRQQTPLVHTHTALLHLSAQSSHPDQAWELLTLIMEPDVLYEYTQRRRALPPRQSLLMLKQGYLAHANAQKVVELWLRYGRPPFNPPQYDATSTAINAAFRAVVVRQEQSPAGGAAELAKSLSKIAREATPPFTGTTRA